jgi:hypothetical protein
MRDADSQLYGVKFTDGEILRFDASSGQGSLYVDGSESASRARL